MKELKKDAIANNTREKIKGAKEEYGLKYTQLARDIGINIVTIYNFISSKQTLSLENLLKINDYINEFENKCNELYSKCI